MNVMNVADFGPGGPLNVACPDCDATIALYCFDASKTPAPCRCCGLHPVHRPFGDYCDGRHRAFAQSLAQDRRPPYVHER